MSPAPRPAAYSRSLSVLLHSPKSAEHDGQSLIVSEAYSCRSRTLRSVIVDSVLHGRAADVLPGGVKGLVLVLAALNLAALVAGLFYVFDGLLKETRRLDQIGSR